MMAMCNKKNRSLKQLVSLLFVLVGGMALYSCDDDETITYVATLSKAPELTGPVSADALLFSKADADELIEFSWNAAQYNYQASVSYGIEFSLTDDFAVSKTLIVTSGESAEVKVSAINNVLISMELPLEVESTINCRVFSQISSLVQNLNSTSTEFKVVPYETLVDYPMVYVPGAYQGWSPGEENGRLFSYEFNTTYEGIIRIGGDNGSFKITPAANWDDAWGGVLTATENGYSGSLDAAGGDFSVAPGIYEFSVDIEGLTIELEKTDDWGMIGSAVPPFDWSEDVDMFYNGQRRKWELTGDFREGVIKFRANDDWDLNYGSENGDGTLQAGAGDIPLSSAGNYTIRMDLENMEYTILGN